MKILLLLFAILFSLSNYAQQYSFIRYGVKEGLAQSQVTDISQDNLGYLWIGTQSGLSKFDGIKFENYSIDDGLADNTIHKLLFDSIANTLWIATPEGLTEYKNNTFNSYYFDQKIKVNDLILFKDSIFIASNQGVLSFKNGNFSTYTSNHNIRQLSVTKNNKLLCATNIGLFYFDDSLLVQHSDSLINNLNYSGIDVNKNNIILSTHGMGIFKYNTQQKSIYNYPIKDNDWRGISVYENVVWGVSKYGLTQIENDSVITYYSEQNGLPLNSIKTVYKDKENNIWVGTYGKGLLKYSGKSIMSYTVKDGLSSDIVMTISEEGAKEFTFGTYNKGITVLSNNKVKTYTSATGLNYNSIWTIKHSKNGEAWIGSSRGVNVLKNGNIKTLPTVTGKIRSIYISNENLIYFGGKTGLWLKSNDTIVHILSDKKYDINKIICSKDKLFLATKNGLYWQYLNQLTKDFNHVETKEENCNSISLDAYGNTWIATVNGLFIQSPDNNLIEYTLEESNFKSKNILGLIKDSKNNMWLSTANGVYELLEGNPFNNQLQEFHFSDAEGVVDLESNLNAIYEDSEGKIWVGTSSALLRINPELNSKLFSFSKPKLSIKSIKLFQENFNYTNYSSSFDSLTLVPNQLKLPFNKNHLTFSFIGINLKNPLHVKYSYRLLGAEEDWSPLLNNTSATYSFISPGEYQFQLKATNNGIDWTDVKTIDIIISPPFWKTWWFIALLLFGLSALIYFVFQVRIRSIKQKKDNEQLKYKNRLRELEQQSLNASMNRHFIFNSLNSIQYFINSSDKLSANRYLSNFAKLIRKNLDSSTSNNFIVNLQEEIDRIKLYLTLEKMRFGDKFDYTIKVDENIDIEMTHVPSMILQPFVENSIIHGVLPLENGGLGKIDINIKLELDSIIFEVIDNGVGIDNSLGLKDTFTGDHESKGMLITANRIELLRKINGKKLMIIGPFQINNEKGKALGTKVIIKLPQNDN